MWRSDILDSLEIRLGAILRAITFSPQGVDLQFQFSLIYRKRPISISICDINTAVQSELQFRRVVLEEQAAKNLLPPFKINQLNPSGSISTKTDVSGKIDTEFPTESFNEANIFHRDDFETDFSSFSMFL